MVPVLIAMQRPWWCPMCGTSARWGWGMMIVITAVWLIALVLVLVLVWQLVVHRGPTDGSESDSGRAEEILRRRYARGEIDRETYERMLTDLRRGAGA